MGMGRPHDRQTPGRLLEELSDSEAEAARKILEDCSGLEVAPGTSYTRSSLPDAALLIVEHGFVVLRSTRGRGSRAIVTCEAGAGIMLLPPAPNEVLEGLIDALVIVLGREVRDRLLELPGAARAIVDGLAATLAQKQEALGNFASTRHIDRVRSKVLQLSRTYGRVARDGIRIDFPLSHGLLAEMIGSSRETVTRAVDELQRTGFVVREGHTYRLLVRPEDVVDTPPS